MTVRRMTTQTLAARGFTLVEIAIVITIVGLLLTGGILIIDPAVNRERRTETVDKMKRIEDALQIWVIETGGCLPCPADGTLTSASANNGFGRAGGANQTTATCENFGTTCDIQPVAINHPGAGNTNYAGVVPWRSIGLSEEQVTDGWGNRIAYAVTDAGANQLVTFESGNTTPPLEFDGSAFQDGALTVTDITPTNITTTAAYVIISRGEDGAFGYSRSGPGSGGALFDARGTAGSDQGDNADNDDVYVQDTAVDVETADYFDDMVRWKSGPLITYECGPGSCGNAIALP